MNGKAKTFVSPVVPPGFNEDADDLSDISVSESHLAAMPRSSSKLQPPIHSSKLHSSPPLSKPPIPTSKPPTRRSISHSEPPQSVPIHSQPSKEEPSPLIPPKAVSTHSFPLLETLPDFLLPKPCTNVHIVLVGISLVHLHTIVSLALSSPPHSVSVTLVNTISASTPSSQAYLNIDTDIYFHPATLLPILLNSIPETDCTIDIPQLCDWAGARYIKGSISGLDIEGKKLVIKTYRSSKEVKFASTTQKLPTRSSSSSPLLSSFLSTISYDVVSFAEEMGNIDPLFSGEFLSSHFDVQSTSIFDSISCPRSLCTLYPVSQFLKRVQNFEGSFGKHSRARELGEDAYRGALYRAGMDKVQTLKRLVAEEAEKERREKEEKWKYEQLQMEGRERRERRVGGESSSISPLAQRTGSASAQKTTSQRTSVQAKRMSRLQRSVLTMSLDTFRPAHTTSIDSMSTLSRGLGGTISGGTITSDATITSGATRQPMFSLASESLATGVRIPCICLYGWGITVVEVAMALWERLKITVGDAVRIKILNPLSIFGFDEGGTEEQRGKCNTWQDLHHTDSSKDRQYHIDQDIKIDSSQIITPQWKEILKARKERKKTSEMLHRAVLTTLSRYPHISIMLNSRIQDIRINNVYLSDGSIIKADLFIVATPLGITSKCTQTFASLGLPIDTITGRLRVLPSLQVSGCECVFAAGGCSQLVSEKEYETEYEIQLKRWMERGGKEWDTMMKEEEREEREREEREREEREWRGYYYHDNTKPYEDAVGDSYDHGVGSQDSIYSTARSVGEGLYSSHQYPKSTILDPKAWKAEQAQKKRERKLQKAIHKKKMKELAKEEKELRKKMKYQRQSIQSQDIHDQVTTFDHILPRTSSHSKYSSPSSSSFPSPSSSLLPKLSLALVCGSLEQSHILSHNLLSCVQICISEGWVPSPRLCKCASEMWRSEEERDISKKTSLLSKPISYKTRSEVRSEARSEARSEPRSEPRSQIGAVSLGSMHHKSKGGSYKGCMIDGVSDAQIIEFLHSISPDELIGLIHPEPSTRTCITSVHPFSLEYILPPHKYTEENYTLFHNLALRINGGEGELNFRRDVRNVQIKKFPSLLSCLCCCCTGGCCTGGCCCTDSKNRYQSFGGDIMFSSSYSSSSSSSSHSKYRDGSGRGCESVFIGYFSGDSKESGITITCGSCRKIVSEPNEERWYRRIEAIANTIEQFSVYSLGLPPEMLIPPLEKEMVSIADQICLTGMEEQIKFGKFF
ncbi:hypothetical protein ADUPG1_014169 [Aduncisulcus paluster]|uniref:Uncharacterized protein n=1 Tax=Aduncisulcus paluster TaxID=2918883 RepID=A0ABQ5KCU3_9EUKA|nr:hypothetical protein ADUPG1_014169 [Aduncisulcus paluster]